MSPIKSFHLIKLLSQHEKTIIKCKELKYYILHFRLQLFLISGSYQLKESLPFWPKLHMYSILYYSVNFLENMKHLLADLRMSSNVCNKPLEMDAYDNDHVVIHEPLRGNISSKFGRKSRRNVSSGNSMSK